MFQYNDTVRILQGAHKGRVGAIVGIPTPPNTAYTVEFGDGTDAELSPDYLAVEPEDQPGS